MEKGESWGWISTFPLRSWVVAAGMWESRRDFQGLWAEGGNLLLVFLCRPNARHFRSAVRSCSFLKLEAGKELPLCFLHLDGGSGTGLTSGLPVEIIQGDIVPQKPGHAG